MRRGLYAGLIAGTITSIIPFVNDYTLSNILGPLTLAYSAGIQGPWQTGSTFIIWKALVHIVNNAIWGAIFGLISAILFDKISGKWIKKGLIIGLILIIFSVIRPTFFHITYGGAIFGLVYIIGYSIDKFIYGILFAAMYKR